MTLMLEGYSPGYVGGHGGIPTPDQFFGSYGNITGQGDYYQGLGYLGSEEATALNRMGGSRFIQAQDFLQGLGLQQQFLPMLANQELGFMRQFIPQQISAQRDFFNQALGSQGQGALDQYFGGLGNLAGAQKQLLTGTDTGAINDYANVLGQSAAAFGLEGSPFAAQGYTKALGGAAENIRAQRIQSALGIQSALQGGAGLGVGIASSLMAGTGLPLTGFEPTGAEFAASFAASGAESVQAHRARQEERRAGQVGLGFGLLGMAFPGMMKGLGMGGPGAVPGSQGAQGGQQIASANQAAMAGASGNYGQFQSSMAGMYAPSLGPLFSSGMGFY